jgi:uncharacterized heparinase superfamily protein
VLNGADPTFYASFLRSSGEACAARGGGRGGATALDRLSAAIALSYAALCCSGLENRLKRATRLLAAELEAQILPDGGHVSRHPGVMVELLLDLLPLRLLYASRNIEAPDALGRAVDRMMPMLRYLRGGGRELALFNGMGPTAIDQVATLLSYDTVRGSPPSYAEQSGYTRLEAGGTVIMADTGAAPPLDAAAAAHAGCLSFELVSDGRPVVVNVGSPGAPGPARTAARRTAAHSTLVLGDISSALLIEEAPGEVARFVERQLGPILAAGPARVRVERGVDADGWASCVARHDGYEGRFGITHERRWSLAPDGGRLDGTERLLGTSRQRDGTPPPILRFHLHPDVRATRDPRTNTVELALVGGDAWRFRIEGPPPTLEESIYFGGPQGRRPTSQIVVRLNPPPPDSPLAVRWTFERVRETGRMAAREEPDAVQNTENAVGAPAGDPEQS